MNTESHSHRFRFVGEPINVDPREVDPPPAIGEPGAPRRFVWRGETVEVARVAQHWRETKSDRTHGSGEQYTAKHWFEIEAIDGRRMKIYFERHARSKAQAKKRWWLYGVSDAP